MCKNHDLWLKVKVKISCKIVSHTVAASAWIGMKLDMFVLHIKTSVA